MRVVDQIIEYTREQGLLNTDDLDRLTSAGFIKQRPAPIDSPVDGRWTERHWEGFTCEGHQEEADEGEPAGADEPDETELTVRSSKSGRRGQAERHGRRWTPRRARRVRRQLARAWRQPARHGGKNKAA